jgi:hypothetical protein
MKKHRTKSLQFHRIARSCTGDVRADGRPCGFNTGTELQAAFTSLNGMVGGYGKQIMVLVGFFLGAIGIMLAQAASAPDEVCRLRNLPGYRPDCSHDGFRRSDLI